MTETRIGAWTIRQNYSFYAGTDNAYYAEHDEYDGSSRYAVYTGRTVDDVVAQLIEDEGVVVEMAVTDGE